MRLDVVPLTAAETYELVLLDLLLPERGCAAHESSGSASAPPTPSPTSTTRCPGGGRPGNESPLVAVRCEARYHGRPGLDVPPPIGDVPAVTHRARSAPAGVEHDLDLLPFLADTGLAAGRAVVVEQLSDGDLLAALAGRRERLVAAAAAVGPGARRTSSPIAVPNPGDRAAIAAALADDAARHLADRYVVCLAASHPYADWLFEPLEPAERARSGSRCTSRSRRAPPATSCACDGSTRPATAPAGAATCAVVRPRAGHRAARAARARWARAGRRRRTGRGSS